MGEDTVKTVAGYIAIAVPLTVVIGNLAKIVLEWLTQRHSLNTARIQQAHQITTHYLDKALDPSVPLAIRHQLLRFLATPDKAGSRLSDWAKAELGRVESVVDETNRAVAEAEKELLRARSATEVASAEKKLALATSKQRSLLEPPQAPPISAAALRAGMIEDKQMVGLNMTGADLHGVSLLFRDLRKSDFGKANLTKCHLSCSDLRGASFNGADVSHGDLSQSDLRGGDLRSANLTNANLKRARLEGADLSGAVIAGADLRVTYDDSTKWPEGFDPDKHGAVKMPTNGDDKLAPA